MTWLRNFTDKWKSIAGFAAVVLTLLIIGCVCPLSYDLNDEAMLQSILSGSYTGTPDGHAIYMKYPLTGILSLLYRIADGISWLSLFLGMGLAVCAYSVLKYVANSIVALKMKILGMVLAGEILVMLLFEKFVVMNYTVMAAVFGGTALFLVAAGTGENEKKGKWVKGFILLALCYMIRPQMFWLLVPFLAVALLWHGVKPDMKKEFGKRAGYLAGFAGILGVSILLLWGVDRLCYLSKGWQEFEEYNDARTRLYDYAQIISYEQYPEIYEEIGITKEQYTLLVEYGLILDEDITAQKLDLLAEAGEEIKAELIPFQENFRKRFDEYYYRTLHDQDYPDNLIVLALYAAVIILCLWGRQWFRTLLIVCLGAGRSLIWLYLMLQGRYPDRITDSLYLMERLLLGGMLVHLIAQMSARQKEQMKNRILSWGVPALTAVAILLCVPGVCTALKLGYEQSTARALVQKEWDQVTDYMNARAENFYYLDVYSTVSTASMQYEKPMYENYMLMGGWVAGSVMQKEKQASTGYESPLEALTRGENIFLVAKTGRDMKWIEDYAASIGLSLNLKEVDLVGEYSIYSANN